MPFLQAAYVADRDLIGKLCTEYSQLMDPFHFILPKTRRRDFNDNPFDYLLRASGMKNNNPTHDSRADDEDDVPILPLLDDENETTENDDDEALLSASLVKERSASFLADQQAIQDADADIPDADQLGRKSLISACQALIVL